MHIFGGNRKKKGISQNKKEIIRLDAVCNNIMNSAFGTCRMEFGREFVRLMDIKRGIMQVMEQESDQLPVQEMLAAKILKLMEAYIKQAVSFTSMKKAASSVKMNEELLADAGCRLEKIQELVDSLNFHFHARTGGPVSDTGYHDLINEAEALCTVLKDENKMKMEYRYDR